MEKQSGGRAYGRILNGFQFSKRTVYFYDLKNNRTFTKDTNNYINALGIQQLNTLGNVCISARHRM
ncbi:hypothetical protein A8708_16735 [Paenibacillus oryzisoli]|uniref:Uncharacterized protein n=1 Tax=Paenibacillus oryzisoli TaxID=1850517 RepID=A0A198AJB4_9BACL|nr:hypothetical protein A8708_16735 [Paenibacillus oryzisoli]